MEDVSEKKEILRFVGNEEESFSDYVFMYQKIPGVLPLELQKIDGVKECVYDISGMITLEEYFSNYAFGREDIVEILEQLLEIQQSLEEYLLDAKGMVMQLDFIFINPKNREIGTIYYQKNKQELVKALEMMMEYVMKRMDHENKELSQFVYGLDSLLQQSTVTRKEIWEYLCHKQEEVKREYMVEEFDRKEKIYSSKISFPTIKEYLMPMGIGLLCIVIFTILWSFGMFQTPVTEEMDVPKIVGALLFFVAIGGYGIWKTLPQKKVEYIHYSEEG